MPMFDQNSSNNTPDQNPEPTALSLEDLVGEGKKYATVEELAKGYAHASAHIGKLESENNDLRVQTQASKSVEQILAEMRQGTPSTESDNITPNQDPDNGGNDAVDIKVLLQEELDKRESTRLADDNKKAVINALTAKYGERAGEMFDAKAKELGVNLEELSAQAPQLVLQSFGVDKAAPGASASSPTGDKRSGVNQSGVTAQEGTKAYYQQLRDAGHLTRSQYYEACNDAISRDAKLFNS